MDQNLKRIYDRVPDEKLPNPLKELLEQLGQKKVGD
ncbi:MAG: NepR family anti-sigma factor [Paracoccaceae bacterium]